MFSPRVHLLLALPLAPLCVPATACSTIDAGGTSTSAGGTYGPGLPATDGEYGGADSTEGEPPPVGPDYFDYCLPDSEGSSFFMGWQIACTASSATRSFVNPLDDSFVEIENGSGPIGNICCGSIPYILEADSKCQELCLAQLCEAARAQHVAWAADVSNDGMGGNCLDLTDDCGFDFELCKTGALHEQVGNPGALFSYFLQAECEAVHDQALSPYGANGDYWNWVEYPNDPSNDPAVCAPPPEPGPGDPERAPENEMEEEPGTTVTLSWSIDGGPIEREQSLDADVDFAYAVDPCTAGECIGISRLHVTLPDGAHRGMKLENLHLLVEQTTEATPLSASGTFSFGSRSLRATLSLSVDGIPLVVTGYNEGRVDGVVLPRADAMTLTNLVFGFRDGPINAALELNINGTYVRHAPDALVKVVEAPIDCASPVTFEAASSDLDGDALTHVWWVPPWFLGTGNLLDATMPPGPYRVFLTSFDASGRFDSTAFEYVRSCL